MCLGIPMQVAAVEPGHAWCEGRGARRRVDTALIGEVARGDWVLVFLDTARERLDAGRAAEVNAALDLLEAALGAPTPTASATARPTTSPTARPNAATSPLAAAAVFDLPSAMSAAELAALTGQSG